MANKQLELMGRYMTEFGLTPASRARVAAVREDAAEPVRIGTVEVVFVSKDANLVERPLDDPDALHRSLDQTSPIARSDLSHPDGMY